MKLPCPKPDSGDAMPKKMAAAILKARKGGKKK
jgi:hypothetical protein